MARPALPILLALSLFAAASPAAAQAPPPNTLQFEVRTVRLNPGEIRDFTIDCPTPLVALSGRATARDFAITVVKSAPGPARTQWSFRVGNRSSGGILVPPRDVTVVVTCGPPPPRRVVLRGGRVAIVFGVGRARPTLVPLRPRQRRTVRVKCPPETQPAGTGQELQTPSEARRAQAPESEDEVVITEDLQRANDTLVTLVSRSAEEETVRLTGTCIKRRVRLRMPDGERQTVRVLVSRPTATVQVPPGTSTVTGGCPRGQSPITAGYALPPTGDVAVVGGAYDTAGHASLDIRNLGSGPAAARVRLSCVRAAAVIGGDPVSQTIDTETGPIEITQGRTEP